jgi:hypothetical protein
MLTIFIVAVLVSVIFERQERRHAFTESLEYLRMGKRRAEQEPKFPLLESWMGVAIGIYVVAMGVFMVWADLMVIRYAHEISDTYINGRALMDAGAFIAGGIAILFLSLKSVLRNRRFIK